MIPTGDSLEIKLAGTYCDAVGIDKGVNGVCNTPGPGPLGGDDVPGGPGFVHALSLTPDTSTSGKAALHTLSLANDAKIPQLQDGHGYYVINASSTQFQLSLTSGGAAINVTDGGHTGGPHVFTREGIHLSAGGTGKQRLVLDLTASGASGTHRLIGAGGSAFTTPTVGDGVTTASATGLAIGAITVQGGHATAGSNPTVTITIGGSSVNPTNLTAHDLDVETNSVVQVKSESATDGGGLIGVGDSHATGTATTTSTVTLGSDAHLTALGNVTVKSRSELHISGSTNPNIIGFIGVAKADTELTVDWKTETDINGGIDAGATATIDARTYVDGLASARANGAGFGADSDATARLNVGTGSLHGLTRVDFGGTKHVNADTLNVNALIELARVVSDAYTRSTAAGAGSTADAHSILKGSNEILLESGSYLSAGSAINLLSEYDGVDIYAHAHSICRCFGGYTHPDADAQDDTVAFVNGKPNSTVKTSSLIVTTNQHIVRFQAQSDRSGAFLDFGDADSNGSPNKPARHITWESQTYLLGEPNPVLVIDDTGTIVAKTRNVTVRRNSAAGAPMVIGDQFHAGDTIYIDPIIYDELPTALFRANKISGTQSDNSTIDETQSVFYMQETWDSVHIENNFDAPMVILANDATFPGVSIGVLNMHLTSNPEAVINVSVDSGAENFPSTWQWDVKHFFIVTDVQVLSIRGPPNSPSTSAYPLTLNGSIQNTIGSTTIRNDRGSILAGDTPSNAVITTNVLHLNSDTGSIGSSAHPIRIVLVQWACTIDLPYCASSATHPVVLTAEAGVDIFLDLTTIRRDSTSAAVSTPLQPVIGPIKAGHDVTINVNDSSEGIDQAAVGTVWAALFSPDHQPTNVGGDGSLRTGLGFTNPVPVYKRFHVSGDAAPPDVIGAPLILVAYGTVLTKINVDYRFCGDSTCTTAGVLAGHNLDIHHTNSTMANVTFFVLTDVDDSFVESISGNTVGNHDGSGRIDLATNGSIRDVETSSDLRVGQIQSTGACTGSPPCNFATAASWFIVPTGAPAMGPRGDVTLDSPAAILDAESDEAVPGHRPDHDRRDRPEHHDDGRRQPHREHVGPGRRRHPGRLPGDPGQRRPERARIAADRDGHRARHRLGARQLEHRLSAECVDHAQRRRRLRHVRRLPDRVDRRSPGQHDLHERRRLARDRQRLHLRRALERRGRQHDLPPERGREQRRPRSALRRLALPPAAARSASRKPIRT